MKVPHELLPEFGHFICDPGIRRKLRIALVAVGLGSIAGSVAALMPASQTEAGTNTTGGAPAVHVLQKRCAEQAWPYISQECLRGQTRTVRRIADNPDERGSTITARARAEQAAVLASPSKLSSEPATTRNRSTRQGSRHGNRAYYGRFGW